MVEEVLVGGDGLGQGLDVGDLDPDVAVAEPAYVELAVLLLVVGRNRACENRLKAARERRLQLDPEQVVRDKRIDEATVDVEVALEARAEAQRKVARAEAAAATERLLRERLSVRDVVRLTGLDQTTLRRLRQAKAAGDIDGRPVTQESKEALQ